MKRVLQKAWWAKSGCKASEEGGKMKKRVAFLWLFIRSPHRIWKNAQNITRISYNNIENCKNIFSYRCFCAIVKEVCFQRKTPKIHTTPFFQKCMRKCVYCKEMV